MLGAALTLGAMLILGLAGCGEKLRVVAGVPNQPPRVQLSAHLLGSSSNTTAYDVSWRAWDPDGRVDHYLVTNDPRAIADERGAWARSGGTGRVLGLRRENPIAREDDLRPRQPYVFGVRAVDDRGSVSDPATVAGRAL
jgi:hypothetical protein